MRLRGLSEIHQETWRTSTNKPQTIASSVRVRCRVLHHNADLATHFDKSMAQQQLQGLAGILQAKTRFVLGEQPLMNGFLA